MNNKNWVSKERFPFPIYLLVPSYLYTGLCRPQLSTHFSSRSSPCKPSWYSLYTFESYCLIFLETPYSKKLSRTSWPFLWRHGQHPKTEVTIPSCPSLMLCSFVCSSMKYFLWNLLAYSSASSWGNKNSLMIEIMLVSGMWNGCCIIICLMCNLGNTNFYCHPPKKSHYFNFIFNSSLWVTLFFQDLGNKEKKIRFHNSKDLTKVFSHHLLLVKSFPRRQLTSFKK